jgi:hypothetical protein
VAAIYAAAALIRENWPPNRLRDQEGRRMDLEIPEAHKVTDHMKRKQQQED